MPIPSELDLWRSAGIIVRRHGSEAPREARGRSEQLRRAGDEDGAETWWRISLKCEELLRQEGSGSEPAVGPSIFPGRSGGPGGPGGRKPHARPHPAFRNGRLHEPVGLAVLDGHITGER